MPIKSYRCRLKMNFHQERKTVFKKQRDYLIPYSMCLIMPLNLESANILKKTEMKVAL